jgi:hypothetical protein
MHRSDVLSRRQALAALASPTALVATGVGLAALPAEPDAALRDLFARWQRKTAELDKPSCGRTDEELDALLDVQGDLESEIFAYPTTSLEALKIKAEVASQYLTPASWQSESIDDVAFQAVFDAIEQLASAASVPAA